MGSGSSGEGGILGAIHPTEKRWESAVVYIRNSEPIDVPLEGQTDVGPRRIQLLDVVGSRSEESIRRHER